MVLGHSRDQRVAAQRVRLWGGDGGRVAHDLLVLRGIRRRIASRRADLIDLLAVCAIVLDADRQPIETLRQRLYLRIVAGLEDGLQPAVRCWIPLRLRLQRWCPGSQPFLLLIAAAHRARVLLLELEGVHLSEMRVDRCVPRRVLTLPSGVVEAARLGRHWPTRKRVTRRAPLLLLSARQQLGLLISLCLRARQRLGRHLRLRRRHIARADSLRVRILITCLALGRTR